MNKNNKDFFETVLKDVIPLKKSKRNKEEIIIKKEIIANEKNKIIKNPPKEKSPIQIKEDNAGREKHEKNIVENNKSFLKKIKREKIKINKKIDLHGHTLIEAEKIFNVEINLNFGTNVLFVLTCHWPLIWSTIISGITCSALLEL